MGHACQILTFDVTMSMKQIQAECDEWGNNNCDPYERGGRYGGLGSPIRFVDIIYPDYASAAQYLETTTGDYRQIAVRYYADNGTPQALVTLRKSIEETQKKITVLNNTAHYANAKSQTIKCKNCQAVLPTAYCGKTWINHCPVCHNDMRPQSEIEKIEKLKDKLTDLNKKLKVESDKYKNKYVPNSQTKNRKIKWAVMCEVHC